MKKLLYIALFSIAITANATEKKGVETNSLHEKVVMTDYSNEIMLNNFKEVKTINNKCSIETSENNMLFGCGSEANRWYAEYRNQGFSHREARALRRVWVRKCRGNGPGGWLNLPVQF